MVEHSETPLVTVLITTKNEEINIRPLLDSLRHQSYANFEIILVDNNSTDKTREIAAEFTPFIYNLGPERSTQRNFGIKKARGKYILILDADMIVSEHVIEVGIEKFSSNNEIVGLIIKEISVGDGFWAECKKLEKELIVGIEWIEAARFYTVDILRQVNGYDISLISGEDWDLSQRVKKLGKIDRVDDPIYHKDIEPSFWKGIKKKYFYGKHMQKYINKDVNKENITMQMNIFERYKVYLIKPAITFKNPILGVGMLFIKTCEFFAIALGILFTKINRQVKSIFSKN